MIVGDLDRLVHRDRTVLADCRKRRIDFHAVQVVRNLCILVDIVAAGGDPRDQHVAVLRFRDGRLEVRRIVHGDRDRVAPDAVLVGRELQRGALIFALRVVAVDERKYDGAVIQGNELRIRTFIRVLRKDLRGARRERVARRVLSADPGGIRSASLTEAEALRRGRLPHARLLIADHIVRIINIVLEESERLAGKLDHDRNREQEQVDDDARRDAEVQTERPVLVIRFPGAQGVGPCHQSYADDIAKPDAETELNITLQTDAAVEAGPRICIVDL